MRTLQIQSPPMTGTDVSTWQQFLTAQNDYHGAIDGVYSPPTVQGTIAYQTAKGLATDGFVGTGTYSRAVLDGYRASPGRVTTPGMDAMMTAPPSPRALPRPG